MGRFQPLSRNFHKYNGLIYTIALLCSLVFTSCDSDNGSIYYEKSSSQSNVSNEFKYNYNLLRYYYIDQDKYLGEPELYIDKVNTEVMAALEIPWDYYDIYYMYSQMNDKFTRYIDPSRSVNLFNSLVSSESKMGTGAEIDSANTSKYIINKVAKNSPADKAGLQIGDEIIAIEGITITNEVLYKRLSYAVEGDTINYTVKRDADTLDFSVVLASYLSPTVELTFTDSIPVIKILEFTSITANDSGTSEEFIEALRKTESYKSTIIDLRNNGGGDGDECIPMITYFLSQGDTAIGIISAIIDSIHSRQTFDTTYTISETDGIVKDRYFVFLANNTTASCSELMLAGILANKKFPLVGTVTYGKGIGQKYTITPSISIAAITNMKVIDKDGKAYHKYGIEPDFVITDNDLALKKAVELAKDMNYVRVAGYGTVNTGNFAKISVEPDSMPGFYLLPKDFSY